MQEFSRHALCQHHFHCCVVHKGDNTSLRERICPGSFGNQCIICGGSFASFLAFPPGCLIAQSATVSSVGARLTADLASEPTFPATMRPQRALEQGCATII
eukprot:1074890-Amphidinium_carterae.1